jgi:hypothetical protein
MELKTIISTILGVLLSLCMLFLLPISARANGSIISDWLRVYNPSGTVAYEVSCTESQEQADPNRVYYIPVAGLADPAQFGNPTKLIETSGPLQGQASDIFGVGVVAGINGQYFLAFTSDSESAPAYGDPFNHATLVF